MKVSKTEARVLFNKLRKKKGTVKKKMAFVREFLGNLGCDNVRPSLYYYRNTRISMMFKSKFLESVRTINTKGKTADHFDKWYIGFKNLVQCALVSHYIHKLKSDAYQLELLGFCGMVTEESYQKRIAKLAKLLSVDKEFVNANYKKIADSLGLPQKYERGTKAT